MSKKILRIREVLERIGIKESTLWDQIKKGTFPKPLELGPKARGWPEEDIDTWIACKAARQKWPPSPEFLIGIRMRETLTTRGGPSAARRARVSRVNKTIVQPEEAWRIDVEDIE